MATKGIPYGLSDYVRITNENCYYVDKTHFIPRIEQTASFFFLIRPRRFGKSLTLSMLESYYDINNVDRFEELYGERWIYQHPTRLRAKFLILRFNFSAISANPDRMEASFEEYCHRQYIDFLDRYEHLFYAGFREELLGFKTADSRLGFLNNKASLLKLDLYLIIDEYDNFTNTLLSTYGTDAYAKATHGESFYRLFFNVIKAATTGSEQALKRMFITGVSPITLDDVTSGFNIGSNLSTDFRFNSIVGFSETEVRTMLEYYKAEGALAGEVDELIKTMKPWYDNYCFAKDKEDEPMYNSDMVLYFLNYYLAAGKAPEEMIDTNIRTDYNKLRHLARLDRGLGQNISTIREVLETGRTIIPQIKTSFPALSMVNPDNFKSLLYYFGMLTIGGTERGQVILSIPNHVVREQMYSFLVDEYAKAGVFAIDLSRLVQLTIDMAYTGDWKPVFQYIADELKRQSRIREFIDGEAHVKGFLLAYLGMTNYYYLQPEYESGKGYADFYFRPNPLIEGIEYAYLMEVKYAKADEPDSRIEFLKTEARKQLLQYAADPIVTNTIGSAKLRLITLVFRTWQLEVMEEVELNNPSNPHP